MFSSNAIISNKNNRSLQRSIRGKAFQKIEVNGTDQSESKLSLKETSKRQAAHVKNSALFLKVIIVLFFTVIFTYYAIKYISTFPF